MGGWAAGTGCRAPSRHRRFRLPWPSQALTRAVVYTGYDRGAWAGRAECTLLRAGELLLCPPVRTGHPQIVYQYRATPAGEPRAVERLEAPLLTAYERVMDLVSARRNLTPLTLPGGQQLQLEDFPELAVREALANAIIHRDHRLTDPVVIEHSPTLFSVTSPGPLVPGVTLENILTHRSKPRNPTLARAARLLGIAEEVGRGVDRMYREMIRSGRRRASNRE